MQVLKTVSPFDGEQADVVVVQELGDGQGGLGVGVGGWPVGGAQVAHTGLPDGPQRHVQADGAILQVVELGDDRQTSVTAVAPQRSVLSSPGFCGGWFIWCRWLPVVVVLGGGGRGGCRVPRRPRARRGFASRWRNGAG